MTDDTAPSCLFVGCTMPLSVEWNGLHACYHHAKNLIYWIGWASGILRSGS